MSQWKIEFYESSCGDSPVRDWFLEQEPKVQAKFAQILDLLEEQGTLVGMPYVRPITGSEKLYEIRAEQKTNIYRVLYVAYTGQRFILLHGFQKKTQKTPKGEIKLAENHLKDFLDQEKQKHSAPKEKKTRFDKREKKR